MGMSPAKDRSKNVRCRGTTGADHRGGGALQQIYRRQDCPGGYHRRNVGRRGLQGKAVASRCPGLDQRLPDAAACPGEMGRPRDIFLDQGEPFPLTGKKGEVEEVYSIVNEAKGVSVYSKTTYKSTAQGGLQRLVLIATTALDPKHPLEVRHVQAVGQDQEDVQPEEVQLSADLTRVARVTREAFARGVARRFVSPRYGKGLLSHSHRHDVAMFFTPGRRGRNYLNRLKNSTVGTLGGFTKSVKDVRSVIIGQVKDLLAGAISDSRARLKTAPVVVEVESRVVKRLKTATGAAVDPRQEEFAAEGIMDSNSDEEGEAASTPETIPEEEAGDLIKIGREERKLDGVDYWRAHGKEHSPHLRSLAQAVFGAPSSAGVTERDFCVADMFQPRKRGGVDPANLEMDLSAGPVRQDPCRHPTDNG